MLNITSEFVVLIGNNSNLIMFFLLCSMGFVMLISAIRGKFYGPGLYLGYTGVINVSKETVRKGKGVRIFCSLASFFFLLFAFSISFAYEYSLIQSNANIFFIKYSVAFIISILISIGYYPLMRISTNYFFKHQRIYWIIRYSFVFIILLLLAIAYFSN